MVKKALALPSGSRAGLLLLAAIATLAALGTYFAAERVSAKPPPHRSETTSGSRFGPPPDAVGFARVLISVSNAFAVGQGDPTRISHAHCAEGSRGHYLCAYVVSRPRRAAECHLVQAEWALEPASSFTVVLSGRARKCGSVREAIRSLS